MPIDSRIVKKVVAEELNRIRTISDLAHLLGYAPEALRKEFMRREQTSLSRYISEVRIERAKQLLLKSDRKCKEICLIVGFSPEDVGAHIFKRHAGLSMEEYRGFRKGHQRFEMNNAQSCEFTDKNRLTILSGF